MLIDLVVYLVILWLGLAIPVAKILGFVTGSIWSFFGNKHFTFRAATQGAKPIVIFALIYILTLGINAVTNSLALAYLSKVIPFATLCAFIIATGLSALLNFIGLKYLVFKT